MDKLATAVILAEENIRFLRGQLSISELLKFISKEDDNIKPFRKDIIDLFKKTNDAIENLMNYLKKEDAPTEGVPMSEKKDEQPACELTLHHAIPASVCDTPKETQYRASCPVCDTFMSWNSTLKIWQCSRCGHQE